MHFYHSTDDLRPPDTFSGLLSAYKMHLWLALRHKPRWGSLQRTPRISVLAPWASRLTIAPKTNSWRRPSVPRTVKIAAHGPWFGFKEKVEKHRPTKLFSLSATFLNLLSLTVWSIIS